MRQMWVCIAAAVAMAAGPFVAMATGLDDGLRTFRAGDIATAEKQFSALLAQNPADLGALFWHARCLIEERRFAEAEPELRQVLSAKPDSLDSLYWLGVSLAGQDKSDDARAAFGKVLARKPRDKEALAALAKLPRAPEAPVRTAGLPAKAEPGRRIAISADGLSIDPGQVDILSSNVYDYTWSTAPTEWIAAAGICKHTNRWECAPQWSWYGAYDPAGLAATWCKHEFVGDITFEVYAAMKMGVGEVQKYRNPNDMNLTIHGDGANLDSGYSFMIGANQNQHSCIMKGDQVLAQTEDPSALFPIFEDAYPKDMNEFHRKWWALRARLSGHKLQFYKDEKLILEADDPDPLPGGRVGVWTVHNGIVVARAKIYYAEEKAPPDPLPLDQALETPAVTRLAPRAIVVSSDTHPAIYDDFETDLGHWQNRPECPGVKLSLVSPGAEGKGHALAIANQQPGGLFAADLKTPRLDARRYTHLSFDYKVDPDAKLNLQVVVNSGIYELPFTAPGEIGPQAQLLTEIPDARADGQWHHAEVDLAAYLERIYRPEELLWIEDVYFANRHPNGYIHAGFGGNHAGATLQIDNFYLGGAGGGDVALSWRPVPGATVKGCAWVVDDKRSGVPGDSPLAIEPTISTTLPSSGTYFAHLRPQLTDGSWGPMETLPLRVDRDPPRVAGRTPDAGDTSGAPVIAARLIDTGAGLDRKSIKLTVQGKGFGLDPAGFVLRYEPKDSLLTFDPARAGLTLADGEEVSVELAAADRLNHAAAPVKWQWKYAAARDKTPPTTAYVTSDDKYLCRDDFEADLDQWSTFGGTEGAVVCRDPSTVATGLYSLRLYNYRQGGRFGAYVRRDAFDAGKYRLMSFDYNATGRLRSDFALYVNDRWKSIRFTDTDNPQPRVGTIPDVKVDGQWHHAEVNLYDMFRAADPMASSYVVRYLILGDWGYTGQPEGRTYYIDNFEVAPVVSGLDPVGFSWQTYDTSGIAGASYAFDTLPTTDPGTRKMADGVSAKVPAKTDGVCWFHVRSVDRAGNWSQPAHLRVLVDKDSPTAVVDSPKPNERAAFSQIAFQLTDPGPAGINPASIQLKVAGQQYDVSSPALSYDSATSRLVWDGSRISTSQPITFQDGQVVSVELVSAADFAGNPAKLPAAYSWTMDYSKDNQPPVITVVRSTSHLTYISNTFEDGLGQWLTSANDRGGKVELNDTLAASGRCSLQITNLEQGGSMRAIACAEGYSVDRYPIISFDYNLAPDTKFDLLVLMDDKWYPIAMTNDPRAAIDRIPGAVADGKWHHATVQLSDTLRKVKPNGALDVQQIVFGDREPFNNAVGAVAHLDNFIIGRVGKASPTFRWAAADATGVTDYSYDLDQDPTKVPDEVGEGPTTSKTFRGIEPGEWYFHLRARDGAGHWGDTTTYAIIHDRPRPTQ